jgi:ElaB/YqjD/DUF883 family membrane-anchored ribosome-binding protein
MADAVKEAGKMIGETGAERTDRLFGQIDAMREELASITDAISHYGADAMEGVQHNAVALAKEVQHQGAAVAHQVGKQAQAATRKVQDNPIQTIVILAAIALVSAVIFKRD